MSPLSGVLGEAWALYRRHAPHFILISFVIYLVIAVINALLSWALGPAGTFIGLIFSVFGMFLLQAALVKAVQDVRDGTVDLDLRATIAAALPFVGSVALASILASIGIAIGFILIIVPGLILLTFWSLIVPEIVIGGAGALDSFGRSWRTVRGYAWKVFGTFILVFLILIAVQIVLSVVLLALPYGWRSFIADLVSGSLVAPFLAAVVTLIYYRLTAAHGQPAEPGAGYGAPYGTSPYGPPGNQPPYGTPPNQPPYGTPPNQPPYGTPPNQPPYGTPPNQPPYGTPADQPPHGTRPYEPPADQPPYGTRPYEPPADQPPYGPPPGGGRPLSRLTPVLVGKAGKLWLRVAAELLCTASSATVDPPALDAPALLALRVALGRLLPAESHTGEPPEARGTPCRPGKPAN